MPRIMPAMIASHGKPGTPGAMGFVDVELAVVFELEVKVNWADWDCKNAEKVVLAVTP